MIPVSIIVVLFLFEEAQKEDNMPVFRRKVVSEIDLPNQ